MNPQKENSETLHLILEALDYDPSSGTLTWKKRPASHFRTQAIANRANAIYAGKPAGRKRPTVFNRYTVFVGGAHYYLHRVAWALYHGTWPTKHIDHIDQDPTNNRIENLRQVDRGENHQNLPKRRDNKSTVTGVHWCKRNSRWMAYITKQQKREYLGVYQCFEDAVAARRAAETRLGFHANHGVDTHASLGTCQTRRPAIRPPGRPPKNPPN